MAAPGAPATGGKGVIGSIVVDGNVRVSDVAFYNSLKLKKGDPYDEVAIREEFRRVWDLNLFDDMTVEARQRTPGVYDLIFHVRDRPLISNVAFVGMKAVTETNIQERLNQAKVEVRRGQPVDFSVLRRAEAAIEQLLAEKGYLQSHVRAKLLQINPGQREVTFYIHEGGKTKIQAGVLADLLGEQQEPLPSGEVRPGQREHPLGVQELRIPGRRDQAGGGGAGVGSTPPGARGARAA